jgi:hypothetical protein
MFSIEMPFFAVSRIIFEDFQNNILILNSRNDDDSEGNSDDHFSEIIQKFMEVFKNTRKN